MGINDRDYMRRGSRKSPTRTTKPKASPNGNRRFVIFLIVLALVSLVIWAIRTSSDAREKAHHMSELTPVDINNATKEQLKTLPGIGDKIAARIISGRPYKVKLDLLGIDDIGNKTLDRIEHLIVVGDIADESNAAIEESHE